MARRKDQTAARETIIQATLVAIRDRGIASLRMADIAAIADVSTGTIHYYFGDFDTLLKEVHRLAAERFYADRLAMMSALPDSRDRLCAMITTGLPRTSQDALVTALYRLASHLGIRDDHALLITALYDKQVALYMGILDTGVAQGHFTLDAPAVDVASNLVTLEDGYGLHIITANASLSYERAVALIAGYARTATGCGALIPNTAEDAGVTGSYRETAAVKEQ